MRPRQLEALQLRVVGKVGERLVVVGDDLAEIDRRRLDRLVLAELAIGHVQVAEADALEDLHVAGDRLRIVHRGGDEVVEVDVLDVEGAPHMGAAVLEDLRHSPPVADGIEGGVFTSSGRTATWLRVSAVAKILTRMVLMPGRRGDARPLSSQG